MPALDGFRAVASLSVIVYHAGYGSWFDGVTAFFVLSGFLITTLLLREQESVGTVSLRAFYGRRALRIFPAYYSCVAVSFAIDYLAHHPWPAALTSSAVGYVVNYYNGFHGHPSTSIAHLWSLGVEEQFYLLWPALFLVLAPRGMRALRNALLGIVAISAIWRCILFYGLHVGQAYLYNAFDARFDNLAIGCLLAVLVWNRRTNVVADRLAAHPLLPLITLTAMLILERSLSSTARHLFGFTAYSGLCAVLIVQLLALHQHAAWRWLDWAPMNFLGTISYPIYLYHAWGLGLGRWMTMLSPAGQFVAGIAFTVAGAVGSYFIVERPFLAIKRRFAQPRSAPAAHRQPSHDAIQRAASAPLAPSL